MVVFSFLVSRFTADKKPWIGTSWHDILETSCVYHGLAHEGICHCIGNVELFVCLCDGFLHAHRILLWTILFIIWKPFLKSITPWFSKSYPSLNSHASFIIWYKWTTNAITICKFYCFHLLSKNKNQDFFSSTISSNSKDFVSRSKDNFSNPVQFNQGYLFPPYLLSTYYSEEVPILIYSWIICKINFNGLSFRNFCLTASCELY